MFCFFTSASIHRNNLWLTLKRVAVLCRFSSVHLLCLFPSQNKCTRYWPDPDTTKDISTFHVRYLQEFEYSDYTLREFELTSESNVSVTFITNSLLLFF